MTLLPDHVLKLLTPEQRKAIGKAGITATEAQAKYQKVAEKAIHESVRKWLTLRAIPYVHSRMDKASTIRKGWPDFTVLHQGRAYCLELKAPGGVLSDEQKQCLAELETTGTPCKVAYSDAEAISWLKLQIDRP